MKNYRLYLQIFGLLILILAAKSHAATDRGIVPVAIKGEGGKQVLLYKESHALVIGVSEYTNGWPRLPGVMDDLREVTKALESQDFNVVVVRNPTRETLVKSFDDFINKYGRGKDNRLLFYFAGHGYTDKPTYGGEIGYIVPADAPDPNRDLNGFLNKAMDMEMFTVYAKRVRAKHALFLFDSCFSGSLFALGIRAIPEAIQENTSKAVRQFITAGTAEQTVPDRSLFRDQFVKALSGEADLNKDGYVTGTELGLFLQDTVTNYSHRSQTPKYGRIRDPNLDKGDFVFSMKQAKSLPAVQAERKSIEAERLKLTDELKTVEAQNSLNAEKRKLEEVRKKLEQEKKIVASLPPQTDPYATLDELPPPPKDEPQNRAHVEAIESKHPGYKEYLDSVDKSGRLVEGKLNKWISAHPLSSKWKRISKEGTADEVNYMLDTFKRENGIGVKAKVETQNKQASLNKNYATLEELPPRPSYMGKWVAMDVEKPKAPAPAEEREIKQESLKKEDSLEKEFDRLAKKPLTLEKEAKDVATNKTKKSENTPAGMAKIPGGTFYAGLEDDSDNPVRTLEIATFSIDKYEVTQSDFEKVMGSNPSHFKGCPTCPVESVTWHEADAYCKKVGKRLPTEWEWEKAAKAGSRTMYYWGDDLDDAYGWWGKNSGNETHPVGEKKPNGYSLYDMAGNVWEWTASDYDNSGEPKVLRGGSWFMYPYALRSASRFTYGPGGRYSHGGFRCAQ